jgi:hypothetical protein
MKSSTMPTVIESIGEQGQRVERGFAWPETPSRRAALGVLASVSALALPTAAIADVAPNHPDADILALAERCEAAARRAGVASDAYAVAEFASPHNQAEEDEALRLQGVALDEFRDASLSLIWARASTIGGLIAKARAAKFAFPEDNWIVTAIQEAIRDNGIFEHEPMSLSLARDLIAIAGEDA